MDYFRITAVAVLLMSGYDSTDAAVIESRAALDIELRAVRPIVAEVYRLAEDGDRQGVLRRITQAQADPELGPTARDHLIHESILALSRTEPDAASRTVVEGYRDVQVTSWIRLRDEHGRATVPLYDLAAAARLTLHNWDTSAARRVVSGELARSGWSPQRFLAPPGEIPLDAWQAGSVLAVQQAGTGSLYEYLPALIESHRQSARGSEITYAFARKLAAPELYRELVRSADTRVALRAIATARKDLGEGQAVEVLKDAATRDDLASAAILAAGPVTRTDVQTQDWLLEMLGEPARGASAALALARESSPAVLDSLRSIIVDHEDELASLRAALALRLSDAPEALALRAALLQLDLPSGEVRRALQ